MPPIIPIIIGVMASVTYPLSYLLKKRRDIILTNVISRVLYVIQYVMIGAFSGAVLDVVGAFAAIVAQKKDTPFVKKHLKASIILVNVFIVVAGVIICYFEKSPLGLLTTLGVLIHTNAFWLTEERAIRRVTLIGSPFWLSYNILSGAYGSVVGDFLTITSVVTALIKYRKNEDKTDIESKSSDTKAEENETADA